MNVRGALRAWADQFSLSLLIKQRLFLYPSWSPSGAFPPPLHHRHWHPNSAQLWPVKLKLLRSRLCSGKYYEYGKLASYRLLTTRTVLLPKARLLNLRQPQEEAVPHPQGHHLPSFRLLPNRIQRALERVGRGRNTRGRRDQNLQRLCTLVVHAVTSIRTQEIQPHCR